jgi:hypothetical protein
MTLYNLVTDLARAARAVVYDLELLVVRGIFGQLIQVGATR